MKNIITFDIEDWFHILDCPAAMSQEKWASFESRVERNTLLILNILGSRKVRATFFILGWVAEKFPDLVREIDYQGHEIASHGYYHLRTDQISLNEFKRDVADSIDILSTLTKQKIRGFRAPGFSVKPDNYKAFETLLDLGIEYDSSIFPAKYSTNRYPNLPNDIGWIKTPSGQRILEIPATPIHLPTKSVYLFGGGYFRLAPHKLRKIGIKQLNKQGKPAMVYLHPREFDPDHPQLPMSRFRHFKTYYNIDSTKDNLRRLLSEFKFGSIDELAIQQKKSPSKPLSFGFPNNNTAKPAIEAFPSILEDAN